MSPLQNQAGPVGRGPRGVVFPSTLNRGLVAWWPMDERSGVRSEKLGIIDDIEFTDVNTVNWDFGPDGKTCARTIQANTEYFAMGGDGSTNVDDLFDMNGLPNLEFTCAFWHRAEVQIANMSWNGVTQMASDAGTLFTHTHYFQQPDMRFYKYHDGVLGTNADIYHLHEDVWVPYTWMLSGISMSQTHMTTRCNNSKLGPTEHSGSFNAMDSSERPRWWHAYGSTDRTIAHTMYWNRVLEDHEWDELLTSFYPFLEDGEKLRAGTKAYFDMAESSGVRTNSMTDLTHKLAGAWKMTEADNQNKKNYAANGGDFVATSMNLYGAEGRDGGAAEGIGSTSGFYRASNVLPDGGDFTLCWRIRPDDTTGTISGVGITYPPSGNTSFNVAVDSTNGRFLITVQGVDEANLSIPLAELKGHWWTVFARWNAVDEEYSLTAYDESGTSHGTVTATGTPVNSVSSDDWVQFGWGLTGLMDEIDLWHRHLDDSECDRIASKNLFYPFEETVSSMTQGLLHYWNFDTEDDFNGAWRPAQVGGIDAYSIGALDSVPGRHGNCVEFTEVNNYYLRVQNCWQPGVGTLANGGEECAFVVWVWPDTDTGYQAIVSRFNTLTQGLTLLDRNGTTLRWYQGSIQHGSEPALVQDQWNLIVAQRRGDVLEVSVNGGDIVTGNSVSGGNLTDDYKWTRFGIREEINEFNGKIDEPMIYNRPLEQGEINRLWAGEKYPFQSTGIEVGLSEHWKFEETSGDRIGEVQGLAMVPYNTTAYETGMFGNGAALQDTNGRFQLTLGVALGRGAVTASIWFYPRQNGNDPVFGDPYSTTHGIYAYIGSNDNLVVQMANGTSNVSVNVYDAIELNEWNHLIAWWDPSDDKLHVEIWCATNGLTTEVSSSTLSGGYMPGVFSGGGKNYSMALMSQPNYAGGQNSCIVDEFSFWNRNLSATERTIVRNQGIGREYPWTTNLGPYPLSEYNTPTTGVGKYGTAVVIDKNNSEYLEIADAVETIGPRQMALSAWYYPTDASPATQEAIISLRAGSTHVMTLYRHSNGTMQVYSNGNYQLTTLNTFNVNEWNHVCAWFNKDVGTNGTCYWMLNGVEQPTGGAKSIAWGVAYQPSVLADLAIGRPGGYDGLYAHGRIDEAMLIEGPFSMEDCKALYREGQGRFMNNNLRSSRLLKKDATPAATTYNRHLEAYWHLDEYSGVRHDAHGDWDLQAYNNPTAEIGKNGNAVALSNTKAQYLQLSIGDDVDLPFSVQQHHSITWAGWVYAYDLNERYAIFTKNGGSQQSCEIIQAGYISWYYLDTPYTRSVNSTTGSFSATTWHFVAARWNHETEYLHITIDDSHWSAKPDSLPPIDNTATTFQIGMNNNVRHLNGRVSEAFVSGRFWSDAELEAVYNSGSGRFYPDWR